VVAENRRRFLNDAGLDGQTGLMLLADLAAGLFQRGLTGGTRGNASWGSGRRGGCRRGRCGFGCAAGRRRGRVRRGL